MKTWKQVQLARRERITIPRTVQQTIPVNRIWEDGTFLSGRIYSRCYRFSDVNYQVVGKAQREEMFRKYQLFLGAMEAGGTYKLTVFNRHINMAAFEAAMYLQPGADGYDAYRDEYNEMLRACVSDTDGRQQERYLTISVSAPTLEEAKAFLSRSAAGLAAALRDMGSRMTVLSVSDRLRLLHDFYRPGEENAFAFDFRDTVRRGHDFRDCFAPPSIERHANYLRIGKRYVRSLIGVEYGTYVEDDLLSRLAALPENLVISMDIVPIPMEEAENEVQHKQDGIEGNITRWQQRQNRADNFSAIIPYDLRRQREEMQGMMDELVKSGQQMFLATLTLCHMADSLEALDSDTAKLSATRGIKLFPATFQQLDAMHTALPYGVCRIEASRTLLTRCLAAAGMPFRAQEVQHPGGIWYGVNQLTRNLILINQAMLMNKGMFLLGVPGAGKSMLAKERIVFVMLSTTDHIFINDPTGEYALLVRALGGTVITLRAGGSDHINAMEMLGDYTTTDKSLFAQTLMERMEHRQLTAQEASVLDRCVKRLYDCGGKAVTLTDLRVELLSQPEPQARELALTLERYTSGSLDVFAHETNVDLTGRLICFDLHELHEQLRAVGQLIVTDTLVNRVADNKSHGIVTHVITDEIKTFCEDENSQRFLDFAWRQWRKTGTYTLAITQNVGAVLDAGTVRDMLGNSELIVMLHQAEADSARLAELFGLSEEQLAYVSDPREGCGLLKCGASLIPFENRFPKQTRLYRLMTTKPEEMREAEK